MTARFLNVVFTPSVKAAQTANGARAVYAKREDTTSEADRLTENEAAFIGARDSFYMATISESGWPYVQHRGGPRGFVKVLSDRRLGFADYRGNRQYVSVGNLHHDDRVALFFMDYPNRLRLKLLGRVRIVDLGVEQDLAKRLIDADHRAKVERGLVVEVEAFDWNCSQQITERYTLEDIAPTITALQARVAELEAALAHGPLQQPPAVRDGQKPAV